MIILVVGYDEYAGDGIKHVLVGNDLDEVMKRAHDAGYWFATRYMKVFEIASNEITTVGDAKDITDEDRVPST